MADERKDGKLRPAVKETRGKEGLFFYDSDDNIVVEKPGKATRLLAYLPELYDEHMKLRDTVATLLSIIVDQQAEILQLSTRVELAVNSKIAIQMKKSMDEVVKELVSQGVTIRNHEVTANFRASAKASSQRESESETTTVKSSARDVESSFAAAVDQIGSLTLGSSKARKKMKRDHEKLRMLVSKATEAESEGSVSIKWGEVEQAAGGLKRTSRKTGRTPKRKATSRTPQRKTTSRA